MANPKHVAVVRKGAAAIEEWKRKHPEQTLNLEKANLAGTNLKKANLAKARLSGARLHSVDLSETNLSEANLSGATLFRANLREANLNKANLSGAELMSAVLNEANLSEAYLGSAKLAYARLIATDLHGADLSGAEFFETTLNASNLSLANLSGADLKYSDLTFATLSKADLTNANLRGVKFIGSKLLNTKFIGAVMNYTTFATCNLAKCIGLEIIKHTGPSNIDYRTLQTSFYAAGNRLTSEMQTFLVNSGIPAELVEALPKILKKVPYCSSFICYGHPDLDFAKTLVKDLKARGVSCWLYSMDYTPGEKIWREITQKRQEAEKMIVICSSQTLIRDGVLKEIEEQIDEDPDKIVPISLDNTWKQSGFVVKRGQHDLKPFLLERNYADFCDESKYNESLSRLLRGIKRT